ncbi:MAG TPA: biopolymer transporter ExbD [Pirellulaceae bacterium]|nr:biopolymer transporter ExbD [Pirellulaceae bacterium]HMO92244.1 biopolymer transporter ExbD [Pirellulaceae bacterium]HMP70061.1 biopolymer transporter ExbD [Pirellulaceae bacterium]
MAVVLNKPKAVASLSILPLIDVVFLLIIFFLVATRFVEAEQELDVSLPSASEALPVVSNLREVVININRDGEFYLDGKYRLEEEVEQILRQRAANNPLNQTVVIRVDKETDTQYFITAIDICKRVGIQNYTAMIDKPHEQ